MDTEENKALVRRLVDDVINGSRPAALDELLSESYADHAPGMEISGSHGIGQVFAMLRAAFPIGTRTSKISLPRATESCSV